MGLLKIYIRHFCLLSIACCLLPIASFSQTPSVQTTADKYDILIGEQVKVTIRSNFHPGLFTMPWLVLPDSIPHFEIVEAGKADTITQDDSKTIEHNNTIHEFRFRRWVIPRSLSIRMIHRSIYLAIPSL